MAILGAYFYRLIIFIVKDIGEKMRKKAKKCDILRYFKIEESKSRKTVKNSRFYSLQYIIPAV